MFCNYPVEFWFYLAALPILVLALFRNCVQILVSSRAVWLGAALTFTLGMYLLPSENHLMGDGMQRLADTETTFIFTEALDHLIHRLVYLAFGSAIWSYRIVGIVLGLLYLNGIRLLVKFGESAVERAIIALSFLCTATIQFYFGYAESYGLLNVSILYYLYFGWNCAREDRLTIWPLLMFVIAVASHLSAVSLLPSLLFLYRDKYSWVRRFAPAAAIVIGTVIFFAGRFWHSLVTMWPNDYSTYSLLCGAHLSDLVCTLVLVSPAFLLALPGKRWDKTVVFTVITLAGTLLFTIFFDPVLGIVRDWDVLSIFALPLAGLIALRSPRSVITIGILATLIIIRIVPWLVFNSKLQTDYIKKHLEDDIHYTCAFADGERLDSWGILLHRVGDSEGAEAAWTKRLQCRPDRIKTMAMLAPLLYNSGKYPQAFEVYQRMAQLEPDNPKSRYHCIYTLFRMARLDEAFRQFTDLPPEFRNNVHYQRLLAGMLGAVGRHADAVALLEQNSEIDTEGYLPFMLAKSAHAIGRDDLSVQLARSAVALDSTNLDYRQLAEKISAN